MFANPCLLRLQEAPEPILQNYVSYDPRRG